MYVYINYITNLRHFEVDQLLYNGIITEVSYIIVDFRLLYKDLYFLIRSTVTALVSWAPSTICSFSGCSTASGLE